MQDQIIVSAVSAIYLSLVLFTILFQIGLVFGRPWGEWTMGGYNKGVLPTKLRAAALLSIGILGFIALFVIDKSGYGLIKLNLPDNIKWLIIGFNILSVIANSVTKSKQERKLWQPITVIMLMCSLIVFI